MSEAGPEAAPQPFDGHGFIDDVRHAYRGEDIHYSGRRNPEQQEIALLLGEEADEFVNDGARFILSMTGAEADAYHSPEDILSDKFDEDHSEKFGDMRSAFRQLYVAVGIASQRLHRDGEHQTKNGKFIPSLIDLPEENRRQVLYDLFSDFQELNALRMGAEGSGLLGRPGRVFLGEYDDDDREIYHDIAPKDRDIVTPSRLWRHMQNVKYRENFGEGAGQLPVVHAAGKLSPDEYRELRRNFPEVEKADFDRVTSSSRNAAQAIERSYLQ